MNDKILIPLSPSIMTLTTSASPGSPWPRTSPVWEPLTLTCTETCLSGQTRPGRAPAPAQTRSRCFFRSPEMRKVTRGLRDKLSNRVNILLKFILENIFLTRLDFICSSNIHRQVRWTFHNASSEVGWKGVLYWNIFQGEDNLTFWILFSKILSCHLYRPTGTRLSSTAGSTTCTWPASTARRSSGSSRWTKHFHKHKYLVRNNVLGAHYRLWNGQRALLEQRHRPGRGGQVSETFYILCWSIFLEIIFL